MGSNLIYVPSLSEILTFSNIIEFMQRLYGNFDVAIRKTYIMFYINKFKLFNKYEIMKSVDN
jgi:hypothetical protein